MATVEWYQLRRIKGRLLKTFQDLFISVPYTSIKGTIADQQIDPGMFERSRIYGFDESTEDLRRNGESDINTIGIVGMGGSGKTTLCHLVYNHPVVKREFIPRIWVSLPNKFDSATDVTRAITEYILKELGAGDDGANSAGLDKLLITLHRHLSGKKYLIVFDNVWDVNSWYDKLVNMSQMTTQQGIPLGGGIIISSRLEEDVKHMVGEENLHCPPALNPQDCWSVFMDELKRGRYYPFPVDLLVWNSEALAGIKTEIVQNCNSLPSAAKICEELAPIVRGNPEEIVIASEYLRV